MFRHGDTPRSAVRPGTSLRALLAVTTNGALRSAFEPPQS